ncbi:MAG: type II toxin-antitoxin system VapC family toxin [Actinomycetota bacterium]
MIAVDTNILVYAHHALAPQHAEADEALRDLAGSHAAWAIPVFVIGEFLRVVTHPRGPLRRPTSPAKALEAIDVLVASPSAQVLMPGRRYLPLLRGLVVDTNPRGEEVFDAQIAALCLEHGASTILTNDTDFRQFSGITVRPLG